MLLRVNPNRMELLRLRRRLLLARRGHHLLQDKLEEMMRRFLILLKDIDKAQIEFQEKTSLALNDLLYSRIVSPKDDFTESLSRIRALSRIDISTTRVMNVKVPVFQIGELLIEKGYDFSRTSAQLDLAVAGPKTISVLCLNLPSCSRPWIFSPMR